MGFRTEQLAEGVVIHCGDCREVLPTLGRFDALVTDPPYGVDFKGKTTKHTRATREFPGGYAGGDNELGPSVVAMCMERCDRGVVFPGNRLMFAYPEPYDIGSVYCPSGAGLGRWGFISTHPMLFYGMGLPHTRQGPSGFQSFDVVEQNGHPCPKPLRWMEWAVNKCSTAGQSILEPFLGSGTTGVACVKLGRKFTGIEIDPGYFDIACRRIEAALKEPDFFVDQRAPKAEQLSILDGDAA